MPFTTPYALRESNLFQLTSRTTSRCTFAPGRVGRFALRRCAPRLSRLLPRLRLFEEESQSA
eukprot:3076804-Alexandrium_andersonii.AAC.1